MNKILKIQEPFLNTYTSYGCLFSVMDSTLWPWVFNNFIQVCYAHDWKMHVFQSHHMLLKNCPGIHFHTIPQDLIKVKWKNSLKEIIIDSINNNYYLFIYIDRYYISSSHYYQREHLYHEAFIYGYDIEKSLIYIGDNLSEGKFEYVSFSFEEVEEGYWATDAEFDFFSEVRILKPNENSNIHIDLGQIVQHVHNYLYSVKTYDLLQEQEFEYGLNSIEKLLTDIKESFLLNSELDRRSFHLLYEHKLLFEKRVEYLITKKYIEHNEVLLEGISDLKKWYLILRNTVLKYNFKKNPQDLIKVESILKMNILREEKWLDLFLNIVKTSN